MGARTQVTGRSLVAALSLAFIAAAGWFLYLRDSWTDSSILVSSYSLLSYLAMMCSAYILVDYRIRDETEQTVFHAALFYVSIVSMVKAARILLGGPFPSLAYELLVMLLDLCIFGVILLISVLRRRSGGPRRRVLEVLVLVFSGLLAQFVGFVLLSNVGEAAAPVIGTLMGVFAAATVSGSGVLWLRHGGEERMFDTNMLVVGFLVYGVSWIPLVISLYQPSIIWTLTFSLRGVGLVFLVMSTALPFLQQSGTTRNVAYAGALGLQAVAILPLFITETVSGFFSEGAMLGIGVHIIVHLGAAILAVFIAVVTAFYNAQRFEIRRYPLIAAFLVWGCLDAYQVVIAIIPGLGLSTASITPYASAVFVTLLLLPLSIRWANSEPTSWIVSNRHLIPVAAILGLFLGIWVGETYRSVVLTLPTFPYARILILASTVFIMFAFVYSLSLSLRASKGRPSVDLLSIGFLLPWIVPTLIRASYGEMSLGWGIADLLLLMTMLVSPVVLGAIYLEEMKHAEEQKKRAQLYADLLVHDITNYHQALEIGFGLISLDDADPSIQKRAVDSAYKELRRADGLIRDVRRLSMVEQISPATLHRINLIAAMKAAYKIACRELDIHDRSLQCIAEPSQFYALGSNLLIDAMASLFDLLIRCSTSKDPIEVQIRDSESHGKGFWDLSFRTDLKPSSPLRREEERLGASSSNQELGISVARAIVEALGGALSIVTSEVDKVSSEIMVVLTLRKA